MKEPGAPADAPVPPALEGGGGGAEAAQPAEPKENALEAVESAPTSELPPPTREELDALRRDCHALKDQLLRRRADFENYRRRVERDRQQAGADAIGELLKSLMPTLDNLERALVAGGSEDAVREGVELTRRGLMALLESRGVVPDDPLGAPFDPQRHQAIAHEEAPGAAEGTVVEVFRKGYLLKDRLLRPALVKVAKSSAGEPDNDPKQQEAVH